MIEDVLHGNARILKDPAPVIQAVRLAEWSVTIAVKPWVEVADYVPATGEINLAIIEALRSRSIVIPVPQQEVRLIQDARSESGPQAVEPGGRDSCSPLLLFVVTPDVVRPVVLLAFTLGELEHVDGVGPG